MFKSRLRKWGLYKNRPGPQASESPGLGFGGVDVAGYSFELAIHGRPVDPNDQGEYTKHRAFHVVANDSPGNFAADGGATSGTTHSAPDRHLLATGHRYRQRIAARPLSIPPITRAADDIERVDEALRITDCYFRGATETGTWVYDPRLRCMVGGRRGVDGLANLRRWLNRVVEAVQHMHVDVHDVRRPSPSRAHGFRLLGGCLDDLAARLRDQDPPITSFLLGVTRVGDAGLRRLLVRHVQDLADAVLGHRHPFALVWHRLTAPGRDAAAASLEISRGYVEVLGTCRYPDWGRDGHHHHHHHGGGGGGGGDGDALGLLSILGTHMMPLEDFDEVYRELLAGPCSSSSSSPSSSSTPTSSPDEKAARLVRLARRVKQHLVTRGGPGAADGPAVSAVDAVLDVVGGLRLHGQVAEAALTLDAVGRWLAAASPSPSPLGGDCCDGGGGDPFYDLKVARYLEERAECDRLTVHH